MTIKEGMYVRTKDGKIHQILDEEIDIRYRFDTGINTPFYKNGEYNNVEKIDIIVITNMK